MTQAVKHLKIISEDSTMKQDEIFCTITYADDVGKSKETYHTKIEAKHKAQLGFLTFRIMEEYKIPYDLAFDWVCRVLGCKDVFSEMVASIDWFLKYGLLERPTTE